MNIRPKTKVECTWVSCDNHDATKSIHHCYYLASRLIPDIGEYTGEREEGNSALCNRWHGVADENCHFVKFADLDESSEYDSVPKCKSCLKIYNSFL